VRAETRVPFAALATVPFVLVLSNSMLVPALPNIQSALHRSLLEVGLLITVFSVTAGLVIPVGGYLSDRFGRKRVMVPSLFIFGLGGLGAAVAAMLLGRHAYGAILAGRVVQGIGAGGTYQVAMALAGDIFRSRERSKALGLLEASNGLGKVASPILGAAVMTIFWYAPFFVYPVIAWTSAILVWLLVREPQDTTTHRPPAAFARGILGVFARKGAALGACFLAGALALFFLFGVLSYYSDVLEKGYHVDGVLRGLVIAIPVAVMALTAYVSGTLLVRRIARLAKLAVVSGLALVAASFTVMFFVHRAVVPFTAAITGMGLGNGLLLPALNTMITSATSSAERGTITALYGTVRFFGAAFGPPAFDEAVKLGPLPPYLGSAALAALALLIAAVWINQRQLLGPLSRAAAAHVPAHHRPAAAEPARGHGDNRLR
jgi:ACDE family multidrug resistance protein